MFLGVCEGRRQPEADAVSGGGRGREKFGNTLLFLCPLVTMGSGERTGVHRQSAQLLWIVIQRCVRRVPAQTGGWFACWQSLLGWWGLWPWCEALPCSPPRFPPYGRRPARNKRESEGLSGCFKGRKKTRHETTRGCVLVSRFLTTGLETLQSEVTYFLFREDFSELATVWSRKNRLPTEVTLLNYVYWSC